MIRFFKKGFKKKAKYGTIDDKAMEELLESVNFYKHVVPIDFYSKLFNIYTENMGAKDDPRYHRYCNEFKIVVDQLTPLYNKILGSRFEKEALDNFLLKFKELASTDFEFLIIKTQMSSFWYQPIRRTREDIKSLEDKALVERFEIFHAEYRKIAELLMGLKK